MTAPSYPTSKRRNFEEYGRSAVPRNRSCLKKEAFLFAAIIETNFLARHLCNCAEPNRRLVALLAIMMDETRDNEHVIARTNVVRIDDIFSKKKTQADGGESGVINI